MADRLTQAIAEARERRNRLLAEGAPTPAINTSSVARLPQLQPQPQPSARSPVDHSILWRQIPLLSPRPDILAKAGIVTASTAVGQGRAEFDLLRTRLRGAMVEHGWRRIGICATRQGAGASTVALNLAFALARVTEFRILLADANLARPALARRLALPASCSAEALLDGTVPAERAACRIRPNLAVASDPKPVSAAAERLQSRTIPVALAALQTRLNPDAILFDLPAMLDSDAATGFLPNCDAVLLVAAAGTTTADEITRCQHMIPRSVAFLGVVLNTPSRGGSR